ncbi:hypothetical protein BS78_03G198700 [Paspalum vaginatum]|nr:hypothetical protein BS78_03G198700 [Paspalum vaginatum]
MTRCLKKKPPTQRQRAVTPRSDSGETPCGYGEQTNSGRGEIKRPGTGRGLLLLLPKSQGRVCTAIAPAAPAPLPSRRRRLPRSLALGTPPFFLSLLAALVKGSRALPFGSFHFDRFRNRDPRPGSDRHSEDSSFACSAGVVRPRLGCPNPRLPTCCVGPRCGRRSSLHFSRPDALRQACNLRSICGSCIN